MKLFSPKFFSTKALFISFLSLHMPMLAIAEPLDYSPAELEPFIHHYQMRFNGEVAGEARMQLMKRGGKLYALDHTDVPAFLIYETTVAVMDETTMVPISSTAAGLMGGRVAAAEYEFKDGYANGYSNFPRAPEYPIGHIDINKEIPPRTIDRSASFILAPSLPLQEDVPYVFNWYNGFDDTVKEIRFQITGRETVTVPMGTFDTYKVEMLGGEPSQILYITEDSPHRLVKIEIIGVPWVYELVSREE